MPKPFYGRGMKSVGYLKDNFFFLQVSVLQYLNKLHHCALIIRNMIEYLYVAEAVLLNVEVPPPPFHCKVHHHNISGLGHVFVI